MKVLVVGSGGREHALAWKIARSDMVDTVLAAKGNVGIEAEPKCRTVPVDGIDKIAALADQEGVDLAVIGPEAPLTEGITEALQGIGVKVFGPSRRAAALEGSKLFAKEVMAKKGIPTASYEVFQELAPAREYLKRAQYPLVIKADGLAAGKGVMVCEDKAQAHAALESVMVRKEFGEAGDKTIIEECLEGEEASFIAFTDGQVALPLAGAQDHKPIFDNDQGPNTGGMGAYSPAPVITDQIHETIMETVMNPVVQGMAEMGIPYVGFLYAGLMIKDGRPKVLEFNARMGDPEAQPLLYRMNSDIVPLMLAAIEGGLDKMTMEWAPEDSVCVVMASGGYPGSYEKGKMITGVEEADAMDGVKVFHGGTALKDGSLVTSGGRVLGVTARAMGIVAAAKKAYDAAEKIKWDRVHYRKDIGAKAIKRVTNKA
jgi:phosphoribosylamine--glycine ligase